MKNKENTIAYLLGILNIHERHSIMAMKSAGPAIACSTLSHKWLISLH